ncbi:pyrimidine reductase family protein [Haloactinomyces albus]|uniref:5-amino-6-(5-phosphoribosylamino)uracil reductase n=1 Tax=Haloactinomyces albus TaxID=1352928 RepID=A0AAE3ZE03_9ACTN|nr:pyrimidine reductase family protein [Haloactinomyces albus]MDR7303198.1 5-amino-6-(5-phosphoribosylamino)uracil reductase [Haloactinomyces albus]
MDRLWPADGAQQVDGDLETFYAYPEALQQPWVRVNFVSSLDGAVTVHGSSRGLSSPEDQRVLGLIRDLSDVVLVGAGTAIIEGYRAIKRKDDRTERRRRLGLSDVPPIALVSNHCSIPPDSPLLTNAVVPPIVLTCRAAPADRRAALLEAGADLVITGDAKVDLSEALAALEARGLRRIGCEGGPTLFGDLIANDLVDELCLSVSPLLTSGSASRIATGTPAEHPRGMRLLSALHADDSLLLLRYGRMPE